MVTLNRIGKIETLNLIDNVSPRRHVMLLYLNSESKEKKKLCLKLYCSSLFFHFPLMLLKEVVDEVDSHFLQS